MKKRTLEEFILSWNKEHNRFNFSAQYAPGTGRPTSVTVRYSASKYHRFYSIQEWERLMDVVEAKSHNTMFVTSNEYLFERGVIEIAVASCNRHYQEEVVAGVLMWIGENFFPNI